MHKQVNAFLLLLVLVGSSHRLAAQQPDTLLQVRRLPDSLQKAGINQVTAADRRIFRPGSFLLPAAFVVYGIVSIHIDAFQDVDETIKEELYTEQQPHTTHIDNYLQYAPAAAVYALNAAGVHGKNNFRDRTMLLGISSLIMGVSVNVTKEVTHEPRPDGSDHFSFPSGHTATAFAAAEYLRQEYKEVSAFYGIAGYAAAAATGYLRILNNRHWMSDVVAGAGVGMISTRLAYWIYPRIKRKFFKDKEAATIVMPSYQNGAFELGMVHHF